MAARETVTTPEAAKLARVTGKTIQQWIRDGMPTVQRGAPGRNRSSLIELRELYAWHLDHVPQDPLDAERTRLAREQADKQALDNAVRRGELGELAVWRAELEEMLTEMRAALLAIPTKEAPQLDGNVNQRKERLERVVREILSHCTAYLAVNGHKMPRKGNGAR